jgi:hypothetical protein
MPLTGVVLSVVEVSAFAGCHMPPTVTACLMCRTPLLPHGAGSDPVCDSPICRAADAALAANGTCRVCGRPLAPADRAGRACPTPACRRAFIASCQRAFLAERDRQAAARKSALLDQARAVRDRAAADAGVADPASFPPAVVPANTARVTNLPDRRKRAFRDALMRLIGRATIGGGVPAAADPDPEPMPDLPAATAAALGRACAVCRGYCCRLGGDHAFLTEATVRRVLAANPGLRPRDLLAAYLDRLGPKTFPRACVFQRADGCALPRELRSDTCNRYLCDELAEFRRGLPAAGPVRRFVAAVHSDTVHTAAFIDEADVRLVRRPGSAPAAAAGNR